MDLSPGSFVCAVVIFGLSGAHMYLWNRKHDKRKLGLSFGGLILSIVPFAFWQTCKEQPQSAYQYAYLSALVVPWVYGLIVEVYICWRILGLVDWQFTRWFIVFIAVAAIALQLWGLFGAAAAKKDIPPAFVGSLLFHGSVTIIFAYLPWKHPLLRHRKLVVSTCCFAVAFAGDMALLALYCAIPSGGFNAYTQPYGSLCLIPCVQEALLLSLLLLIRLNPPFLRKSTSEQERRSGSESSVRASRNTSLQVADCIDDYKQASNSTSEDFNSKLEYSVDALTLLQFRIVNWQGLKDRAEVKKFVNEDAYRLAGELLVITSASGMIILPVN